MNASPYGTINSFKYGSFKISEIAKIPAPMLIGINKKNEKRNAVSCFHPSAIAATIVAPERLIPGINATA